MTQSSTDFYTTQILRAELHCHNIYSNHQNESSRIPFDCGVTFGEQLDAALMKEIDVLFVTNHNTLDGYRQILDYQQNHNKYGSIKIYPAEEVTIDNKGHVIAYGISEEIKPRLTLEETLDRIKAQNGLSCAAHPFAVSNGIREKALHCDLIESFNSNNIDIFSNIISNKFSEEKMMNKVAGSDSHVATTVGRCINTVESENNIDSVLNSMQKGKLKIDKADYATENELYELAHYVLSSSHRSLTTYIFENYHPLVHYAAKLALNSFSSDPSNKFWRTLAAFTFYLTRRASKKINVNGYNPIMFEQRSWRRLISLALIP
ncbi:MAG TPA: PHP-associated domain-containing protein [Nitrososphaeraceae archaeon]|nr:PHP-associated domain-containing protein [Nitrososphaeraceae archaeon]